MNVFRRILAGAAALFIGGVPLRTAGAQAAADPKPAEQVYKNITQLKGTPADQLMPAMQFIASSLGVECAFCHVPGKFEADDKGPKRTARDMMAMTAAINQNSFRGQRQVTCYTCHHGASHPSAMPAVLESDAAPPRPIPAPVPAPGSATPTADDIVARYVAALGGEDAMRKVSSRVMKGKILVAGKENPIEVITKAPNKRVSISDAPSGGSYTGFDGTSGWLGTVGHQARSMTAAESFTSGIDAEFYLALRLNEIFPQLRRGRPEQIARVEHEVLIGTAPGRPPIRLYFDKQSGLLTRMVRYGETPVGRMPAQIDYSDYREVDGVRLPFRWTLSRPNGRFTIQIAEVKSNVPVEDGRFAKPDGEVK